MTICSAKIELYDSVTPPSDAIRGSPRTIRELSVTDVLQVGPGVLAHVLSRGDQTLVKFYLPSVDLWALCRREAAGHGTAHC